MFEMLFLLHIRNFELFNFVILSSFVFYSVFFREFVCFVCLLASVENLGMKLAINLLFLFYLFISKNIVSSWRLV